MRGGAVQWFQQDGATPHTSNGSLEWLRQRFADRLISKARHSRYSFLLPLCYGSVHPSKNHSVSKAF